MTNEITQIDTNGKKPVAGTTKELSKPTKLCQRLGYATRTLIKAPKKKKKIDECAKKFPGTDKPEAS